MKLTVKPLKGSPFSIEVEKSMLVKDVKSLILKEKEWEVDLQKLIHAGKIMSNEKPLTKAKPKPKPTAAAPTEAPVPSTDTAASSSNTTPAATTSTATTSSAPAGTVGAPAATAPVATTAAAPSQTNEGPEFEASVTQLKEMGFPEGEVRAALRAAFGNSSRAVEFLMSGIPPAAAAAAAAPSSGDAAPSAGAPSAGAPSTGASGAAPSGGDSGDPLAALKAHPRLNDLKRIIQNDPSKLQSVLQEIGASNPQLLSSINQNQQAFVRLMNEPIDESAPSSAATPSVTEATRAISGAPSGSGDGAPPGGEQFAAVLQAMQSMNPEQRSQLAQAMGVPPEQLQAITQMMGSMPPGAMAQMMGAMMSGGAGGEGGPPGHPHGGNVVTLTQEEAAAVDRLAELGFPKSACLEAYLACDKDETLAANYLFTNPPDSAMDDSN